LYPLPAPLGVAASFSDRQHATAKTMMIKKTGNNLVVLLMNVLLSRI
jgi:hypothetical protein